MGPLAVDRQALAVPETPVAAEIHQPLDVHRDLAPQIALDVVVAIDQLADAQDLVVGQLVNPPGIRDADLGADLTSLGPADAEDVGEADLHALLRRDIHACDACHAPNSLIS